MNKIKAFIIEDEEPARLLIKKYLENHPEIMVAGEYANGFDAVKAVNEEKPDLIFLDIQMPKLTGFEMLELLDHHPVIIFTTAYDQYAIKAFEMNASDYLLKPFSEERFGKAVNKGIEEVKSQNPGKDKIRNLLEQKDQENEKMQRIAVRNGNKINVIPVDDVLYFEAEGDYIKIHTSDANHLKEKTMKFFEEHLDPGLFVRIHRSYIVNVNEVSRLEQYEKESYLAILKNAEKLKVSKSGYQLLRAVLDL